MNLKTLDGKEVIHHTKNFRQSRKYLDSFESISLAKIHLILSSNPSQIINKKKGYK